MLKKIIKISLLLSISFSLAGLSVPSISKALAQDSAKTDPVITYIEGNVTVSMDGQSAPVPAAVNTALQESSSITTGDNSYCDIALDTKQLNIVSLGPNSSVILKDHVDFIRKVHISEGRVFSRLNNLPQGSTFEVEARDIAIAGARGTAWETVMSGSSVTFNGYQRTFYTQTGSENPLDVNERKAITITKDQPGPVVDLPQADFDRMDHWSVRIDDSVREYRIEHYNGDISKAFEESLQDNVLSTPDGTFAAGALEGGLPLGVEGDGGTPDLPGDISESTFNAPDTETIEPPSSTPGDNGSPTPGIVLEPGPFISDVPKAPLPKKGAPIGSGGE